MKTKNMTTLHLRKSRGWSPLRLGFLLIPLTLVCFALSPAARAVDPPPDGGFPNQNTAEGEDAVLSLNTPASGTWTATGRLATERDLHTATLLPNGKVRVAGRGVGKRDVVGSAEL
jgi:hypothetical protein